ncbi:hypothetical protein [Siccirubricoccus phaeus]|uniref:hypothetical protein n=1 Tax=Siccirubricoccus phaeus TaxID=2595053 RepID=UPI00165BF168|nr:hypothetical protein [Siccirubricoccus phaeus]
MPFIYAGGGAGGWRPTKQATPNGRLQGVEAAFGMVAVQSLPPVRKCATDPDVQLGMRG